MKDRGEYTLTRDAVVNLTAEFLTTRGVPENADAMLDLEVRWVDGSARYRPADVIAWCRERQPPATRRALAIASRLDEMEAEHLKYLETITKHGYESELEEVAVKAVGATIGTLLTAGEAS